MDKFADEHPGQVLTLRYEDMKAVCLNNEFVPFNNQLISAEGSYAKKIVYEVGAVKHVYAPTPSNSLRTVQRR